jgi:hypothetical protein
LQEAWNQTQRRDAAQEEKKTPNRVAKPGSLEILDVNPLQAPTTGGKMMRVSARGLNGNLCGLAAHVGGYETQVRFHFIHKSLSRNSVLNSVPPQEVEWADHAHTSVRFPLPAGHGQGYEVRHAEFHTNYRKLCR